MSLHWEHVGELDVTSVGKLPLEYIPSSPGLYKLQADKRCCYIGQSKNVYNRVYEYCRPTQDLEHEHRLHWLLRGKRVRVEVCVSTEMESLAYRRAQEKLALIEAQAAGLFLLNLSMHSKTDQYKMRIEYHEAMISKYESLLANIDPQHQV